MSKLLAIIFSFLILIQSFNINFEDISKFKILLEHANYHAETYGDSFVEFIAEHYGDAKYQHAGEHEEHKDLPFNDSQHQLTHINSSFILNSISCNIEYSSFTEIPLNFLYKESSSLFEKLAVFQPPRFA
ncbi:hypothetical protein [Psychroserpens ponticola]|uniref:Uncharacterized protein n=1 Tax=Psychroserpens ponticola TaxID=2932268 RepID=A0ABY7S0H2_9FLAO|nr:hypothetical protein [Psychroserpens ponticola]WCO02890.1 hypothetical protein MUN68_005205 [Psychroserpens ponticola]